MIVRVRQDKTGGRLGTTDDDNAEIRRRLEGFDARFGVKYDLAAARGSKREYATR